MFTPFVNDDGSLPFGELKHGLGSRGSILIKLFKLGDNESVELLFLGELVSWLMICVDCCWRCGDGGASGAVGRSLASISPLCHSKVSYLISG